mgnify:CR=1 FL=1
MTLLMRDQENIDKGREQGLEEGREQELEEGRKEGREEGREEGKKKGREEGRREEKSALIRKKLEKGKTISEIADDLEDTEENIVHLIKEFHLGRKES